MVDRKDAVVKKQKEQKERLRENYLEKRKWFGLWKEGQIRKVKQNTAVNKFLEKILCKLFCVLKPIGYHFATHVRSTKGVQRSHWMDIKFNSFIFTNNFEICLYWDSYE